MSDVYEMITDGADTLCCARFVTGYKRVVKMEVMTLETLRVYLADMEPEDVAAINAALDAAIRERAAWIARGITWMEEAQTLRVRAEKAEAELARCKAVNTRLESDLADLRCDKLNNEAMQAEANERA